MPIEIAFAGTLFPGLLLLFLLVCALLWALDAVAAGVAGTAMSGIRPCSVPRFSSVCLVASACCCSENFP